MSGRATEYCGFGTFTRPVDIRPLVESSTEFVVTEDNVPTTGLDAEEVQWRMAALAAEFFGRTL